MTVAGWMMMLLTIIDLVGETWPRCISESNQRSSVLSPFNCSRLLAHQTPGTDISDAALQALDHQMTVYTPATAVALHVVSKQVVM